MTPADKHARDLQKLMENVEKPIKLPNRNESSIQQLRPPRELMKNVGGSSAAAGSGDFHVYKHDRRRELERIRLMEEEQKKLEEEEEFQKRQKDNEILILSKASKNRAKREKRKKAGKAGATATVPAMTTTAPMTTKETSKEPMEKKQRTLSSTIE